MSIIPTFYIVYSQSRPTFRRRVALTTEQTQTSFGKSSKLRDVQASIDKTVQPYFVAQRPVTYFIISVYNLEIASVPCGILLAEEAPLSVSK